MHPGAQSLIDAMTRLKPEPLSAMTPVEARAAFETRHARNVAPPRVVCAVDDRLVDATHPVPVRVYRPQARTGGTLVYFHGGGWVVGSLAMVDALCHDLATQSGCVVVSVDYRLAPEHRFPAALDDAAAVLEALHTGALGFEPGPILVAGDSAGGNIAAVLALMDARAAKILTGQILIYPVTDLRAPHPSMIHFAKGLNLDAQTMQWFARTYLADPALREDWRVSPLAADPSCPPCPALIVTAGYDCLHDEGAAYAQKLSAMGVPTEYIDFPSQIHGFATQTTLGSDAFALRDVIAGFIRRCTRGTNT